MGTDFSRAKNFVESTLASAFSLFADSFVVASDAETFPVGRQIVRLTNGTVNELLLVRSRTGSSFDATGGRGYGGTSITSWSAGTTVELVMTADHLDELQDAVGALENLPLHSWGMTTGIYTVPFRTNSFSNTFLQKDRLYLIPILVSETVSVNTLLCKVSTGGSIGSSIRLWLYRPTGGMNFDLVVDAGTTDGDTTGDKAIGISETLSPALYAGAILHNSTTNIQFRSAAFTYAGYYHLFPQTQLDGAGHLPYKATTFGPLPASLAPPYTLLSSFHVPLVGIGVT